MRDSFTLLDNFIKDTTHELNTPLMAITSNIEMLKNYSLDEKILKKNKTKFFIGFMRRFDPSLIKMKKIIDEGKIGNIQMISITSRDFFARQ